MNDVLWNVLLFCMCIHLQKKKNTCSLKKYCIVSYFFCRIQCRFAFNAHAGRVYFVTCSLKNVIISKLEQTMLNGVRVHLGACLLGNVMTETPV